MKVIRWIAIVLNLLFILTCILLINGKGIDFPLNYTQVTDLIILSIVSAAMVFGFVHSLIVLPELKIDDFK